MKVLISTPFVGGAGGIERSVQAFCHALPHDQVTVVAGRILGGPLAELSERVQLYSARGWRWRAAGRKRGMRGIAAGVMNPLRRFVFPEYDVFIRFSGGADLSRTIRARTGLIISAGKPITTQWMEGYQCVALEAPGNIDLVEPSIRTTLIPPPLTRLAAESTRPRRQRLQIPGRFYLTVFNPYGAVKGVDDLKEALRDAPYPIVWCYSRGTLAFDIPVDLCDHPGLIHLEDVAPEELRFLYENCLAYLCFSRNESFGWAIVDALQYSQAIVSRRIGVLTYPEAAKMPGVHLVAEDWKSPWEVSPRDPGPIPVRDLTFLSPSFFRSHLMALIEASGSLSSMQRVRP